MSCEDVELDLVAFHFGELAEPARGEVEAHLVACPRCLGRFLALKRAVETGEGAPAPSAPLKAAIRGAVAEALGRGPPRWRWWERPLALGFAVAVVLLAVGYTQSVATGPLERPLEIGPPRHSSPAEGRRDGPAGGVTFSVAIAASSAAAPASAAGNRLTGSVDTRVATRALGRRSAEWSTDLGGPQALVGGAALQTHRSLGAGLEAVGSDKSV